MAETSNVLLAIGIVLLVVGGVGLVYGQLMLRNGGQSGDGSFVTIDTSSDSDGRSNVQRLRTYRFGGLVVAPSGRWSR